MRPDAPDQRITIGRTAGWLWLFMSAAVIAGVLMPTAGEVHPDAAIIQAAVGTLIAVASLTGLIPFERIPMRQHELGVLVALPGVTLALWSTGGAQSYALPVVCLPLLFTAFFFSWRWVACVLVLMLIALASPFAYDDSAVTDGYLPVYFTAVMTGGVLAGVTHRLRGRLVAAEHLQREMALTDALTGVGNRRAFDLALSHQTAVAQPDEDDAAALLMIDLDNFKRVNDLHGHTTGDAVLLGVATRCAEVLRPNDRLCRIGGDEFAVVAPRAGRAGAQRLAADLRDRVAAVPMGGDAVAVSGTVVWALVGPDGHAAVDVMRVADQRLHEVKDGRSVTPEPGALHTLSPCPPSHQVAPRAGG